METADAHDRRAAEHDRASRAHAPERVAAYSCGDSVLNDQLTSGTERLVLTMPCWDPEEEVAFLSHHREARKERAEARGERRAAANLVRAELAACRNIPEHELNHSPFAHRKAIIEVIPHYEGEHIRGARVVFAPVLGLTEQWIREDIQCQQARHATFGNSPSYLPEDPSLVDGARVSLTTESNRIVVLIETDDDATGHQVLARAQRLVVDRTATR